MTSNIGARYLGRQGMVGFQTTESATDKKVNDKVLSEVKRNFNPEFLNRLDDTIIFEALTDADLEKIVDLLILQMNENLARRGLSVRVHPDVKHWIVDTTPARIAHTEPGRCAGPYRNISRIRFPRR